jgi:hypothetical protein
MLSLTMKGIAGLPRLSRTIAGERRRDPVDLSKNRPTPERFRRSENRFGARKRGKK